MPLHQLLISAFKEYDRPFVLTETSHPKEDRPLWIKMIEAEAQKPLQAGLSFLGNLLVFYGKQARLRLFT